MGAKIEALSNAVRKATATKNKRVVNLDLGDEEGQRGEVAKAAEIAEWIAKDGEKSTEIAACRAEIAAVEKRAAGLEFRDQGAVIARYQIPTRRRAR